MVAVFWAISLLFDGLISLVDFSFRAGASLKSRICHCIQGNDCWNGGANVFNIALQQNLTDVKANVETVFRGPNRQTTSQKVRDPVHISHITHIYTISQVTLNSPVQPLFLTPL